MPKSNQKEGLTKTHDKYGKEVLLKEDRFQVMMEWEKPYMEACIEALKPSGDVLEIGFGLGYSATHIQSFKPNSHTIIECDHSVINHAEEWLSQHKNASLIEGTWQNKLSSLKVFDAIFFDDYSPISSEQFDQQKEEEEALEKTLNDSKAIKNALEEQMKKFKGIKFSNEDVKTFLTHLSTQKNIDAMDVLVFIDKLQKQENITPEQKTFFLSEFDTSVSSSSPSTNKETIQNTAQKKLGSLPTSPHKDRLILFIETCLDNHMRKGSRLSAFINLPDYERYKQTFTDVILSRADVTHSEKLINITVPDNCDYYDGDQALVIVIEKK